MGPKMIFLSPKGKGAQAGIFLEKMLHETVGATNQNKAKLLGQTIACSSL